MNNQWLIKNFVLNAVVIISYLVLREYEVPILSSLIVSFLLASIISTTVFPVPEYLQEKINELWKQEDPSAYAGGLAMLALAIVNGIGVFCIWKLLTNFDLDENTVLVWTIIGYNAGATLIDQHIMKSIEEDLNNNF